MSNTQKGNSYEISVKRVLMQLAHYFDIAEFTDGDPGYIYKVGKFGKLKLDLLATRLDGKNIVFSCKAWKEKPSGAAVGELLLSAKNEDAEGFLISSIEPTQNTIDLAHGVDLRVATIELDQDPQFYKLTEFLIDSFNDIHIGMAEAMPVHVELKVIVEHFPSQEDAK
jgi:hypothetical protein